jgi:orotidine-5'-phosphate decarboxylase
MNRAPGVDPNRIIVALDILDVPKALALVDQLTPLGLRWFKVGISLWAHAGHQVVEALRERDCKVFLDLKLHDIPHQVGLATQAVSALGVDLLTLHASGGDAMMRAAVEESGEHLRLLAITVLTSLDAPPGEVQRRAEMAHNAGVHGIVCSPLEVEKIRADRAPPFLLVTPGVRPKGAVVGDQRRVATPAEALAWGSDLLVIGRPITAADSPVDAARAIIAL